MVTFEALAPECSKLNEALKLQIIWLSPNTHICIQIYNIHTFAGYAAIPSFPALVFEIHCLTRFTSSILAPALASVVIVSFFSSIVIPSSGKDNNADPPPVTNTTRRSLAVADDAKDSISLAAVSEL